MIRPMSEFGRSRSPGCSDSGRLLLTILKRPLENSSDAFARLGSHGFL
jgi:hypothetical protein